MGSITKDGKTPSIGFVRRDVAKIRSWLRKTFAGQFGEMEYTDEQVARRWHE